MFAVHNSGQTWLPWQRQVCLWLGGDWAAWNNRFPSAGPSSSSFPHGKRFWTQIKLYECWLTRLWSDLTDDLCRDSSHRDRLQANDLQRRRRNMQRDGLEEVGWKEVIKDEAVCKASKRTGCDGKLQTENLQRRVEREKSFEIIRNHGSLGKPIPGHETSPLWKC